LLCIIPVRILSSAPIIIDLVILVELSQRTTQLSTSSSDKPHAVLSLLSYLLKTPMVPSGCPIINALFKQRAAIDNTLRACVALSPINHMLFEHKLVQSSK
jgi:myo-inositol-1-phosphate synthase